MDSLEVNKAFAAVLCAGIAFMVAGVVGETLVHPTRLAKSALKIEGLEPAAATGAAPEAPLPPIAPLLAKADPAVGEGEVKKLCVACHSFNDGGKAGVGPNLYGIVGLPHGHMEGYSYSAAIKGKQGPWTFDELNEWLKKPTAYAPGTKMGFAGINNDQQRANVIDYLRTNAKSPQPLPPVTEAPAATPAAAPADNAMPANAGPKTGAAAGTGGGGATGQQNNQGSANQNQSQLQTNQSQQPPQVTGQPVTPSAQQQPNPLPETSK